MDAEIDDVKCSAAASVALTRGMSETRLPQLGRIWRFLGRAAKRRPAKAGVDLANLHGHRQ